MPGLPKSGVQLVAEDFAAFQSAMENATDAVTRFGQTAERAGGGVSSFGQVAIGALRQVGVVAIEAGIQGAKAIGGFVVDAVKQAGDFESGMLRFGAVTGEAIADAGMELSDFSALFLKLGADTQFSAGQAQEAAINLAKGGLTPAQIAGGALADTLTLAAAGELDLARAADITAKQLGVWSSAGVTSAQVADLLSQAANASTVGVDDLALGLANVGGIAKVAGLSFGETVQAMALLAPGFSSAADAGTSFKTFLTRLQPTTSTAAGAMLELGLLTENGTSKFYDAQGSFIGMGAAAQLLQDSLGGLTEAQKVTALQAIFGQDAFRAAALIAEQGAAGYDAMGNAMGGVGTAAEQAAAKNKGFAFALETLLGSIDTLKVVLGTALLPLLTTFVNDILTPAVNGVMAFASAFQTLWPHIMASTDPLNSFFNALRVALPGALPFIGAVQGAFNLLAPAVMAVANVMQAFIGGIQASINTITPGIPLISAFQSAFSMLGTAFFAVMEAAVPVAAFFGENIVPILAAVATVIGGSLLVALGGMIAGFVAVASPVIATIAVLALFYSAWQSNFGGIQEITDSVIGTIQSVISSGLAAIQGFWSAHGSAILSAATSAWSTIQDAVSSAISVVQGIVSTALSAIQGFWSAHGSAILSAAQSAWSAIQAAVGSAIAVVSSVVSTVLGQIAAFWKSNGSDIMATASQVWGQISNIIGTGIRLALTIITQVTQAIAAVISTVFGGILSFISSHSSEIQAILTAAWNVIKVTVTTVLSVIQGIISATMSAIQGDWTGAWNTIKETCATIVTGILSIIRTNLEIIPTVISTVFDGAVAILSGFVGQFSEAGAALIEGVADGIRNGASAVIDAAVGAATDAINAVKEALSMGSPSRVAAEEIGTPFVMGIVEGIEESADLLEDMARQLSEQLVDDMALVGEAAAEAFKDMFTAGLSGTAGIARQKTKNLRDVGKLDDGGKGIDAVKGEQAALKDKRDALLDKQSDAIAAMVEKRKSIDDTAADKRKSINDKAADAEVTRQDQIADIKRKSDAEEEERKRKIAAIMRGGGTDEDKQARINDLNATYADQEIERQDRIDEIKTASDKAEEARKTALGDLEAERKTALADLEDKYRAQQIVFRDQLAKMDADELVLKNKLLAAEQLRATLLERQAAVRKELADAEAFAATFTDPELGAKYFKEESARIMELADLRRDYLAATTNEEKAAITQQMRQLEEAQRAEKALFTATAAEQSKTFDDTAEALQTVLDKLRYEAKRDLGISKLDIGKENQASAYAEYLADLEAIKKIEALLTTINTPIRPAAAPGQLAQTGIGSTSSTRNWNFNYTTQQSMGSVLQDIDIAQVLSGY